MKTGLGVRIGPETHSRWWSVENVKRKKESSETWERSIMGLYKTQVKIDSQVTICCGREEGGFLLLHHRL